MPRLQTSGPITVEQVANEFKVAPNLGALRGAKHDAGVFPQTNLAMSMFYGRISAFTIDHTTAGTTSWDLYEWTRSQGWDGVQIVIGTYRVGAGAIVRGSGNQPEMLCYGFPVGSQITIENAGYIIGQGGNGGALNGAPIQGSGGGTAIYARSGLTLYNYGIIGGGGGGGRACPLLENLYAHGGGGASYGGPNAGFGAGPGEGGQAALVRQGFGGLNAGSARGGNGGEWGTAGQGWFAFDGTGPYDAGAAPGAPIDGASFCAAPVYGDVRGINIG